MNSKRILYIIAFVIVVIGFGAMIYFVFIRDLVSPTNENVNVNVNTNVNVGLPVTNGEVNINRTGVDNINAVINVTPPTNVNQERIDEIARGGATIVETAVSTNALAAEAVTDGIGIRYYDELLDQFFQLDALGNSVPLSDQRFPDARSINWSPTDNRAIITFPDGSNILYDFDKQDQVTLPREWNDIKFSPSGDKIAFKNESIRESDRWLAIANPNGSEVQLIEPLGDKANDVAINWSPSGQVVALFRESYSGTSQEIFLIGQSGENFKSIITDGRGFEGQWSPDGSQLLYSVYSDNSRYNPVLHFVDSAGDQVGGNDANLGLQTWSYKCTFSSISSEAYCAVPRFLATGTGIFPDSAVNTNDTIYKINLSTGGKSVLALPRFLSGDQDYTVANLFLSNNGSLLYFTDANSGNVYSIQLK
ncbi:hypothetical protein IID19_03735 [Patescibacteria group bacterium]|nr:hypothetical protein [Patescibacteria group bacterium]